MRGPVSGQGSTHLIPRVSVLSLCLQARAVLNLLLLDHPDFTRTNVRSVDPLPDTAEFTRINAVLNRVKHATRTLSLKEVCARVR